MGRLLQMLLGGGVVKQFTDPLLRAYESKLQARNDADRLAAEADIGRLEAAREIAVVEAQDRLSATRIGRLLIVIPFGLWWASVFAVSIVNPLFNLSFEIHDIPPRFWDTAAILIPAILISDATALLGRKIRR